MNLSRRRFVAQSAAFSLVLGSGCTRVPSRAEVLRALVREHTVPDTQRVELACRTLVRAARDLGDDASGLKTAQAALRGAVLAFQRSYAFRVGPMVDSHALLRASFWPARIPAMRSVLASERVLDASLVDVLGVDAKGLFALEQLLFEAPAPGEAPWLSGPYAARSRTFVRLLAEDVHAYARRAMRLLGDGESLAAQLGAAGQGALDRIVNDLLATLETASNSRVQRVLDLRRDGTLEPGFVQGAASGLSAAIPGTWVDVVSELYERDGRGLCTLVESAAPAIAARLRQRCGAARSAVAALNAPLERLVLERPERLEAAVAAVRALEVAIKVDLSSALGVTLTFTSSDGD